MPNWYPGDSFALGIPRLIDNRLWKVSLRCHVPFRASRDLPVSGHPPLGMSWRVLTLCWMRKERQPNDQPSGQTRSP
jgi:hypothetical protein